jgi:hypothetical protein
MFFELSPTLTLVQGKKKSKNIRNEFPLRWVNVTMFDHRHCLRTGQLQLNVGYNKHAVEFFTFIPLFCKRLMHFLSQYFN